MNTAFCVPFFMLPLAVAQQSVPLSHGVPDDVHFFVHGMTSQTPDPAWARFERAVGILAESGIHEDLIDLATIDMGREQRARVHETVRHVFGLIGRVDWPLLAEREMVVAYRMALPTPEYLALFRVSEDRVGAQVTGIKEMLEGFARMLGLPPDSVREVERQTGTLTLFAVGGVPMQCAAGKVGDVLVLATSTRLATASMRLLGQGDGEGSLGGSARLMDALAALPEPTEDVVFVDVHGFVDFFRQAMNMARMGVGQGRRAQSARSVIGTIVAVIEELDVVDHVVATTRSDGTTTVSTSLLRMLPDFESSALAAAVLKQKRWSDWHRRVPADATGFGFDTGIDLAALYDVLMGRIRESEPFDAMLASHQTALDELREGLGHVSGEMAWVSLPTAGAEGCAMGETVAFLRLEKPEAVAGMLPGWLEQVEKFLAARGQDMQAIGADGMHRIEIAALPWIHPTVGVRGDELVLATSPAALARVDRVREGLEPSIRERNDFAALGVGDRDAVDSLLYGRIEAGMGGLPDLIGAIGFGLSLLPEDRDTRPLLELGAILTKLAPALRELDMGYDWAMEAMPVEAPDTWLTRTVYRYHDPR